MADEVVMDGTVATVDMELAVTGANDVDVPADAVTDCRAALSKIVREAFGSDDIRVSSLEFEGLTASATVTTAGAAKVSPSGFAAGTVAVAADLEEAIAECVKDALGAAEVNVTSTTVTLGAGVHNATLPSDGGGGGGGSGTFTWYEKWVLRVIGIVGLIALAIVAFDLGV